MNENSRTINVKEGQEIVLKFHGAEYCVSLGQYGALIVEPRIYCNESVVAKVEGNVATVSKKSNGPV